MSRWSATAALAVLTVLLIPSVSPAAFHLSVINEIMTSYGGDPTKQFVEIRMTGAGQTVTAHAILAAFDATGAYIGDVLEVPSSITNGMAGGHWIMATSSFIGVTPDFIIPSGIIPTAGGMICWGGGGGLFPQNPPTWDRTNFANYIDCIAYGTYSGPSNIRIGTPTPLDADGHSLQRTTMTSNNAADFACSDPATPTNNAEAAGSLPATSSCPAIAPTPTPTPAAGCPDMPANSCFTAGKSNVLFKGNTNSAKQKFSWKWSKGTVQLGQTDFGDPLNGGTSYRICVYDETAGVPALKMGVTVNPSGTCAGKPCWKAVSTKGWLYANKDGNAAGVIKVKLTGGNAGKPLVLVKAKGSSLPLPAPLSGTEFFAQDTALLVQLYSSTPANCWSSSFDASSTKKNDGDQFKAKTP